MSVINDALNKARRERESINPSSRTIRWIAIIILLAGIVTLSYLLALHGFRLSNVHNNSPAPMRQGANVKVVQSPSQKSHILPPPTASNDILNLLQEVPDSGNPPRQGIRELSFNLTGIIRVEKRLLAVINNTIVEEGQSIGGIKVKKIYNDHVELSGSDKEYTLTLK